MGPDNYVLDKGDGGGGVMTSEALGCKINKRVAFGWHSVALLSPCSVLPPGEFRGTGWCYHVSQP